ncbi:MAG TPA: hypothetical protein VGQ16_18350 [Vicinamibacterales bacterium]|nr:hypothetical protein [Vicinamibacterales bacterium]
MTTDLATRSADAARRIATAKRGRAFDDAVREFVRLLRSVPDSAVAE